MATTQEPAMARAVLSFSGCNFWIKNLIHPLRKVLALEICSFFLQTPMEMMTIMGISLMAWFILREPRLQMKGRRVILDFPFYFDCFICLFLEMYLLCCYLWPMYLVLFEYMVGFVWDPLAFLIFLLPLWMFRCIIFHFDEVNLLCDQGNHGMKWNIWTF